MSSVSIPRTENHLLSAALAYAARGWPVLPLHAVANGACTCPDPACTSIGKHPLTVHGSKDATTDADRIRRWWAEAPTANVGLATGQAAGRFVVGPDGQAGIEALAQLERQHGALPRTPTAGTGSGGRHLHFLCHDDTIRNARNHRGLPIDVRGQGGYVVAPPSSNAKGDYAWLISPDEVPVAEAPLWLLEWVRSRDGADGVTSFFRGNGATKPKVLLTVRPDRGTDVQARAIAYLTQCPPAVSGQGGHDQTFDVARAIVFGFDLGPAVGYDLIHQYYNPRCKPPWSEAELRHKCQDADVKPYDKSRGYLLSDNIQAGPSICTISSEPDIETMPMAEPAPWPSLRAEARHGLAGEIVQRLEPETESDSVAILGQALTCFGSAVGGGPYFQVEGDAHHVNLYLVAVGESSRGRKGTSLGRVMQLMSYADDHWCKTCVASGLSSGEGLIWAVRDPIDQSTPIKEQKRTVGYEKVIVDEGVADKRLLVAESELASVLRVMQRDGNSLSPVLRQAWDTGSLRSLVKNSPTRASGAHISVIGHITRQELAKYLTDTELFNGFANRWLWLLVRRARILPDGGRTLDLSGLGTRLNYALASARNVQQMTRSPGAAQLWHDIYPQLTADRVGLYGAVTARAEAQVLRLSMIYALLDAEQVIDEPHLHAALALWDYADASAKIIFGSEPEDPLPGLVLAKLQDAPGGLTRTQLHAAFHRHVPAAAILGALATLRDQGRVAASKRETAGRPAELWQALRKNELSPPSAGDRAGERSEGSEETHRVAVPGTLTSFFRSPGPEKDGGQGEEERVTL
jgi:hypothetical protein